MYINNDIDYLKYLKNKEIIIFGAGEKGKREYAKLNKVANKVVAFCDNDEKKRGKLMFGIPIIPFEEMAELNHDNQMIVICSRGERDIRKQLMDNNIFNFISISQIDFGGDESYYDEQYFEYQQDMGKFGGKIKASIFAPYIKENMTVVEFGSGGGYLLSNIHAKKRLV